MPQVLVAGTNVVTITGFHANVNNTSAGPWMPGAAVPGIAFGMHIGADYPCVCGCICVCLTPAPVPMPTLTHLTTPDNGTNIQTDGSWTAFDAERAFNPAGDQGCGWYHDPQENLNMSAMPPHWPSSSEDDVRTQASQWKPAALQPAFAQPLKHKATSHIPILRVTARLTKMGAGHYLIDMAKEIQGGITVTFRSGRVGTTVNVGYGEESHDDQIDPPTPRGSTLPGCLNCTVRCCPMRTTNVFHSVWTLRDGEQTCGEHEYKQFRYAELLLSDPSVELLPEDVEGWVVRYPLSSEDLALAVLSLEGKDRRAAPYRKLHPTRGLATWSSSSAELDRVRGLCVYTLLSASLDTSTDSNTRQRSTCHIDMLVANLGLLNLAADRAMVTHNTALMLQADSDILDGWADFKTATVYSMHHAIM